MPTKQVANDVLLRRSLCRELGKSLQIDRWPRHANDQEKQVLLERACMLRDELQQEFHNGDSSAGGTPGPTNSSDSTTQVFATPDLSVDASPNTLTGPGMVYAGVDMVLPTQPGMGFDPPYVDHAVSDTASLEQLMGLTASGLMPGINDFMLPSTMAAGLEDTMDPLSHMPAASELDGLSVDPNDFYRTDSLSGSATNDILSALYDEELSTGSFIMGNQRALPGYGRMARVNTRAIVLGL
jgi:hypothetical protein